jgi:glutamyl-tRNA reductase
VEVAVTSEDNCDPVSLATGFLERSHGLEPGWASPYLYHHEDRDAVRHLFRVASSLDSMVLGEPQILGQLKAAYAAAKAAGALEGTLDALLTRAFSVAKRVRSETEIGRSAVSVSYAAGKLAARSLARSMVREWMVSGRERCRSLPAAPAPSGVAGIYVTNRTRERAEELARLFGGVIVDYTRFAAGLHQVDIVIASSGAPHYIVTPEDVRRALEARRNRPMFFIDIAVPRNIDPAVNQLDNVFLYDIDDLQRVVNSNAERAKEAVRPNPSSRSKWIVWWTPARREVTPRS